jgi:hypothetical protein
MLRPKEKIDPSSENSFKNKRFNNESYSEIVLFATTEIEFMH